MFSKKFLSLVLAAAVAMVGGMAVTSAGPVPAAGVARGKVKQANSIYIVRMADVPVAAYQGKVSGYRATKPMKGQKLDRDNPDVGVYRGYLSRKHDASLQQVGARKLYDYGYVFNGFAAELSDAQAAKLRTMAGVVSVQKDEIRQLDTSTTPEMLGLAGDDGFWATKATGENVVIGIVDGGIWPEHPSFSDKKAKKSKKSKKSKKGSKGSKGSYKKLKDWKGVCESGEEFDASDCNQKLIGARFYNAGFGGNTGIDSSFPFEFNSPRDWAGHGTHTSSTAGGNADVPATGPAEVLGSINGIAPRARISTYKVCWADQPTGGGCATSDSIAAIDQAVADGVDVINYSISGTTTNFRDAVEIAFLYAADAGVFVAASAGNAGPASSTVAHPSPWITTVAAGTHNRNGVGSATLGNAVTYNGASTATLGSVGPLALIDSATAGLPGADPARVNLCYAAVDNAGVAVLDPAKVAGKIVLCDRGVTARVNKSLAVKEAGGLGMILVNTSPNSLNADLHAVPSVHLQNTDRAAVKAYAAGVGPMATVNQAAIVLTAPAPFTAAFSSRGPLRAGNGDLLKPDLIAPGQDILAGVAPPNNRGGLFDLYSGTSMSSPHVAGLAALMKELHPDWSPMAIKSALMTTAYDVLDGPNTNPLVIFRQGAGHVAPNNAADPGLVFDSGWNDWLGFLCGTQLPTSFCTGSGIPVLDPSNFNSPSIAIGDLAGAQTVTRRVTNVGHGKATYTPSVSGMAGIEVEISPAQLKLKPKQTKEFTVRFTRTTAPLEAYTGGQLTWSDGSHSVRIPMVVRPVALGAPTQVGGSYNVSFGYTGPFTATARGLVAADTNDGSISTGGQDVYVVDIPAGTTYARFSLFDANVSPASDLDLYVFNSVFAQVGGSGGATSAEEVNLLNPAPGTYYVLVDGFATANPSTYTVFNWTLGATAAGNMTVTAPGSATVGTSGTIGLVFSGLTPGVKYLGSVAYSGTTGLPNPTIVRVDP